MEGFSGLTQSLQESMDKILIPTVLKMILPYIVAILVFGLIHIIFACFFREQRILRICTDAVIMLVFIVVCVLILLPITTHYITGGDIGGGEISIPEYSGSDPFSEISIPEYSGSDPFQIPSGSSSS